MESQKKTQSIRKTLAQKKKETPAKLLLKQNGKCNLVSVTFSGHLLCLILPLTLSPLFQEAEGKTDSQNKKRGGGGETVANSC